MSAETYRQLYLNPAYRHWSPGEDLVGQFLKVAMPFPSEKLIDFGCGTGRAAKRLSEKLQVVALDFADNACETDVEFHVHDMREPIPFEADYGFCTDVMEHIAPEDVDLVLTNILKAARKVFFQISMVEDAFGKTVNEPLHLTVKPASWWTEKFEQLGCEIKWAKHGRNNTFLAFVSAYANWQNVQLVPQLTADCEANIRENLKAEYREVIPHDAQDVEIAVLGGGPSLDAEAIKALGVPVVTTNGAYTWAVENGIKPAAQIMLDGREFMARFVSPILPNCKYLLCSQVHPTVMQSVPKDQVWMWHSTSSIKILEELAIEGKQIFPIMGGCTVMLRAFILLQMLGFRKFHVFGLDSCILDGKHHAYAQPENDSDKVIDIIIGGKAFKCHYWMAQQAREYMELMKTGLQNCDMKVYGDGLISQILNTASYYGGH